MNMPQTGSTSALLRNLRHRCILWPLALTLCPLNAGAAPLDALLNADEFSYAGQMRLEASKDAINDTLDLLKIRSSNPIYSGTNVGDYNGSHFKLAYAVTDRLLAQGSLWQRSITYRADEAALTSWQLAGQYRFLGDANQPLHLAVRFSAWGDQADRMTKSSPTALGERQVTNVAIQSLRDTQNQADLIGTWRLTGKTSISSFIGAGHSEVLLGDVTANYTASNGCNYLLSFTKAGANGDRVGLCTALGPVLDTFNSPQNGLLDFSYGADYLHLGSAVHWRNDAWSLKGGYQFQKIWRNHVDELIVTSGGMPYKSNHIFVAEVMRKVGPRVALLLRGQVMSNQLVGEVPFFYNQITANKFNNSYGYFSFGIVVGF